MLCGRAERAVGIDIANRAITSRQSSMFISFKPCQLADTIESDLLQWGELTVGSRVRQHARKDFPAQRAHTIEIDLSFANPTRIVECFHIGIRASDSEGYRLRLWRKRRIAPQGNAQAVAQCVPR
jgi:hypothetical protein